MVSKAFQVAATVLALAVDIVSGQTCSEFRNVDFDGYDISTTNRANPTECCADCEITPNCKLYNWFDGVCYLKSAQGSSILLPGAVSGILGMASAPTTSKPIHSTCSILPDVDLDGGDIGATYQSDPANCCADCKSTLGCKAYNWFDGVCYLKNARGNSYPLPGASWDALTAAEKETFVSAIEIAMDRGLYQKFVLIHQEQMGNREAHGTCVFLFWHRKYLLGFENMLRSLGDQYKCLTLPYWDYVQNYATMQNTPQAQR
ncbi:hypothetical protein DYB26_013057, partial [Aphanomyces astaci]